MRSVCRDKVQLIWSYWTLDGYGDEEVYDEVSENATRQASMTALSVTNTTDQFKGSILPVAMYTCVLPDMPSGRPAGVPAKAIRWDVGGVEWNGVTYRVRERFVIRRVGRAFYELKVAALGSFS